MGELMQRSVDLLDLSPESDPEVLLNQIMRQESMIKEAHREPLRKLLFKLQDKLAQVGPGRYCSPRHRMPFNSRHEGLQCVEGHLERLLPGLASWCSRMISRSSR